MTRAVLVLVVLIAWTRAPAHGQPLDFSAVTALLEAELPALGGGELLLWRDGQEIYRRSFGTFDSTQAIPIASASKWLSAGVLAALVSEDQLAWSDTIGTFLPDYPASLRGVTMRQLFSHTSGLPGDESAAALRNPFITLAEAANRIAAIPLLYTPGTAFDYGGLSMHIAGRVAEVASGLREPSGAAWDSLFVQHLGQPLGMQQTNYETRFSLIEGLTIGATNNPRISGGVASTAGDYARFLQMLLEGGVYRERRVIAEQAVREILSDQTQGATIVGSPYQNYTHLDPTVAATRYGLGNWLERINTEGQAVDHSSQGAFGFSPWIDLEHNVVGVLSVKDRLTRVYPIYREVKQRIRSELEVQTSTRRAQRPSLPTALQVYPNPAPNGAIHVVHDLATSDLAVLSLYDPLGRQIAAQTVAPGQHSPIPLQLPITPGVYWVRLSTDAQHHATSVVRLP